MKLNTFIKIFLFNCLLVFSTSTFSQAIPSDADIAANVKSKLSANPALSDANIKVDASDGVVLLTGNANSNTQVDTAAEIAQSTTGVKDVDTSNLTVNGSQQPIKDALITAKVKGMFIQQKLFGDKDVAAITIRAETNNGVVSLSGNAESQTQINNAIKIAKQVNGVKEVKSTIKVLR